MAFSSRRAFLKKAGIGTAAAVTLSSSGARAAGGLRGDEEKTATNIEDALAYPRTEWSMPGRYPGTVIETYDAAAVNDGVIDAVRAAAMLEKSMRALTGIEDLAQAWSRFVQPGDRIGLKVNPVAGKLLSTSPALVTAVIAQLEAAGIPRRDIMIWDRREFQLHEAGFTPEAFPGIRIRGTECKDAEGGFRDANGRLYSEDRIDRDWYYWADCEDSYDEETLPYMVNEGKHSYFSSIVTREIDKIINLPILKNAGSTVTLCMKNLAYGAVTNTGRLHKPLWAETCAQVPCFPPLRDKVVLNIVDGLVGCYHGGPGANPQFILPYHRLLVGSDPVAVDRIGLSIVEAMRIEKNVQEKPSPRARAFLDLAQHYQLGIADLNRIHHTRIDMS
ncbi:MAG: DUF362 domain-containing protein [Bacteroidota bacterium]|nr:DUF362 domain-containing protein [Bacteroidota bacterium]